LHHCGICSVIPFRTFITSANSNLRELTALDLFRLKADADPHKILEDAVVADIGRKHKRSAAQVSYSYCATLYKRMCAFLFCNSSVLPGSAEVSCAAGDCSHPEERKVSSHP